MFVTSEDHLDPLLSNFVCGLDQPNNIRHIDLSLNKQKSNAFVPYRLDAGDKPPCAEGDICSFLIENEWVEAPFGGERWWKEATRIGYSRTNTRGTSWYNNGIVSRMFHPNDEIPPDFVEGRIYTGWKVENFASTIRGKRRAYNPVTGEDGFFDDVPAGFLVGVPPEKRRPRGIPPAGTRWDIANSQDEICRRYLEGESTVDLGERFHTSARTINNWLIKWGIPKRSSSRLNRPNKKK
jgi:hypothetical protein